MAKQRSCAHRREIVKEKTEDSIEERKRREAIKKSRHTDTWNKRKEIKDQRRSLRKKIQEKEEEKEKELAASRNARMALRKKKKMLKELYKDKE